MITNASRKLRVFLCHANVDKKVVRLLYEKLVSSNIDAWLDEKALVPGQDWQVEIPKAIRLADVVVVCLSHGSVNQEGYLQKEIRLALDVADEKPDGTIFVIPAKLEQCRIPERLRRWQWVELFREDGYGLLLNALHTRASQVQTIAPLLGMREAETPITNLSRVKSEAQNSEVTDTDLLGLADLLVRSRKAQQAGRRSLCIQIGVDPDALSILNLPTEHDFAIEFVYYLYNLKNYDSILRLCYALEPVLGATLASKLRWISSKFQRTKSQ